MPRSSLSTRLSGWLAVLVLLVAPWTASHDPVRQAREEAASPPSASHWFGTDEVGRDVWSRFVYGGRWSAGTGAAATALCLLLAWIFGAAAGVSARLDMPVMWLADLFLCLPWLYLVIAVRAALPLTLPPRLAFLALLCALALTGWGRAARLVRGQILEVSQRGYVRAARGFGQGPWAIFAHHLLPATSGLLLAQAMILLPRFIVAELTLSFLGAGAGQPQPSWGSLIVPVKQVYLLETQWWRILPLLGMTPFFAIFALCGRRFAERWRLSR